MSEPRYWKLPPEEGYYLMFTPFNEKEYDYEAIHVTGEAPDWHAELACGSMWTISNPEEHVWYYGPIEKPVDKVARDDHD